MPVEIQLTCDDGTQDGGGTHAGAGDAERGGSE